VLIEAIRLKLPPKLKSRFDKEFKEGLAAAPTAVAATSLAQTAATHQRVGVSYRGQKTHEKQVLAYLEKSLKVELTAEQLENIADSLLGLKAFKAVRKLTALGRRRFPQNPHFYFLEAESYFGQGPYRFPAWKVQPLLSKAAELAHAQPADDKQKALLEQIDHRQQMLGLSNFLLGPQSLGMLEEMFGQAFGGADDVYKVSRRIADPRGSAIRR
jgi:hypothetical protein